MKPMIPKDYVMITRVLTLVFISVFNKRGQLKIHFYQLRDTIHLSTLGTKGLLSAINARIDIVQDDGKARMDIK